MTDYIFTLENDFQPYLLDGYYTFIGPSNTDLLGDFTSVVNLISTTNNASRSINNSLSDKNAVKHVINVMYQNEGLSIYVVEGSLPNGLLYTTLKEYCQKFNINFNQLHT